MAVFASLRFVRSASGMAAIIVGFWLALLPGPSPAAPGPYSILGTWRVNANNYMAELEWTSTGARIKFDISYGNWEPLSQLSFDPVTGRVSFFRVKANQRHEGHFVGPNNLAGTIDGAYKWTAIRTSGPKEKPTPPPTTYNIFGKWKINQNGYNGVMEWTKIRTRIKFDIYNRWEATTQRRFDPVTGKVSFVRKFPRQVHVGRFTGPDEIEGTFEGNFKWTAVRMP